MTTKELIVPCVEPHYNYLEAAKILTDHQSYVDLTSDMADNYLSLYLSANKSSNHSSINYILNNRLYSQLKNTLDGTILYINLIELSVDKLDEKVYKIDDVKFISNISIIHLIGNLSWLSSKPINSKILLIELISDVAEIVHVNDSKKQSLFRQACVTSLYSTLDDKNYGKFHNTSFQPEYRALINHTHQEVEVYMGENIYCKRLINGLTKEEGNGEKP